MCTFTLTIDTSGSAFAEDADAEIANVLRRLAAKVQAGEGFTPEPGGARYALLDSHGKVAGYAKVGGAP